MRRSTERGLVIALLFVTAAYALAEEVNLVTYYPSPRGVYRELRTTGNVGVGITNPAVQPFPIEAGPFVGRNFVTILGGAGPGILETGTMAVDAPGNALGWMQFSDRNAPSGSRWAAGLAAFLEGPTANNRGGRLGFWTKPDSGSLTERMQINSIGNVGIGTTVPDTKLMVAGEGTGMARIGGGTGCGGNYTGISLNGQAFGGCGNYNLRSSPSDRTLYLNRPTGAGMHFLENNATQMMIAPGGNVGIGTATPGAKLHVNGATFVSGKLQVGSVVRLANLGADPPAASSANGDIYYNSSLRTFRGFRNGAWTDLGGQAARVVSGAICGPNPPAICGGTGGFTVTRLAVGRYRITYVPPFSGGPNGPAVVAMTWDQNVQWLRVATGWSGDNTGVTIRLRTNNIACQSTASPNPGCDYIDVPFDFVATGPQ